MMENMNKSKIIKNNFNSGLGFSQQILKNKIKFKNSVLGFYCWLISWHILLIKLGN